MQQGSRYHAQVARALVAKYLPGAPGAIADVFAMLQRLFPTEGELREYMTELESALHVEAFDVDDEDDLQPM